MLEVHSGADRKIDLRCLRRRLGAVKRLPARPLQKLNNFEI